ncbi:MAG: tetraacyldisaccharide 4'-kinase [Bacteroidales bacterium]
MIMPGKHLLRISSQLYEMAVAARNRLYDAGILRSRTFSLPVICIGNITAGGTGKTPHVIYLADKLSAVMEVAVLSRGYLRHSKGFRPVTGTDRVGDAGDEPLQMAHSLKQARVFVDRDRVNGVIEIMRIFPTVEAVILDDGFQHRAVRAGLNILLTDWNRLMTRDRMLPLGRLRESLDGMQRADIIIVSKSPPGITPGEMESVRSELREAGTDKRIWFTTLAYEKPVPLFFGTPMRGITAGTTVLLVTGIAEPGPLATYLTNISARVVHLIFTDHYQYTEADIEKITAAFDAISEPDKIIITTTKDGVRLKEITNIADHVRKSLHYLPVTVQFIENEDEFLTKVYAYAGKDRQDS